MEIGFVGLGKMGGNMVRRLSKGGHQCRIYSINPADRAALAAETGAIPADSLAALVSGIATPRTLWLMVPAGMVTQGVIDELAALLGQGIAFIDCGTSGGLFGLERGYSLVIGGDDAAVACNVTIFACLAPGVATAERTPAREGGTNSSAR